MPPTVLTALTLHTEIDRILPRMNQTLHDYEGLLAGKYRQQFFREGVVIKSIGVGPGTVYPVGLFTVTFETNPIPTERGRDGANGIDDLVNIRCITLHFNGDRTMMPPRTRTKFYFPRRIGGPVPSSKIVTKMIEVMEIYRRSMAEIEQRAQAEAKAKIATDLAAATLDNRKKRAKETAGKREDMFAHLIQTLDGFGRIESSMSGGYVNLALANNVRIKIAIDTDRVFISEIDTPIYFDKDKVGQILPFLRKVGDL